MRGQSTRRIVEEFDMQELVPVVKEMGHRIGGQSPDIVQKTLTESCLGQLRRESDSEATQTILVHKKNEVSFCNAFCAVQLTE
jgi:hypothetical protein